MSAPATPLPTELTPAKTWRAGTLIYTSGGLVMLFCWLLAGDFAWSMKDRSVQWVVQLLLKKFEASDTIIGILLGGLPHALTLLLTPVISYMSDRHRGRWGRRIPFLAISTPFTSLSIIGLAFSPTLGEHLHALLGGASPGLNNSILIVFGVFWTIFEVSTITANTVFFALINDVVPQALLGRFYGLFRALGLAIAIGFNFWLFGKAETHFAWIFMGVGVIYGVGFLALCLKVNEGEYPPPPPAAPGRSGAFAGVKTYGRECFTLGYYLWVYASVSLAWMALSAISLFNVLFAKHVGLTMDSYGKLLALTYLISFTLSYFIGMLADRFHPFRVSLIAMALFGTATLAGGFIIENARTFAIMLVSTSVLSGLWQTSSASLTMRLFPRAKYAQYESARALVTSLGLMLVGPALGKILDLSGHDYRLAYLTGGGLALLSLTTGLVAYRSFRRLGGPAGYLAPE
ncbi:MFS transporter [Nibricoccus aquaticus]|uniref:MFS transporter n=1 Tax=Nibricoccus aquaticus TaxID=2576891 RepID=A0A290QF14_9BACT|nr:MFS transporter [Nibricoccus aquaticus]ATC65830.1 MFS transporter [Nibricoccus aquaticus]